MYSVGGLVGIIVSMSLLELLTQEVYAPSPSFSRQTITDDIDDWSFMSISGDLPFDKEECVEQNYNFSSPDIGSS